MNYEYDEQTETVKQKVEKTTKRYVARTLTAIEATPEEKHNDIIKRQFYWMMDDILKIIDS